MGILLPFLGHIPGTGPATGWALEGEWRVMIQTHRRTGIEGYGAPRRPELCCWWERWGGEVLGAGLPTTPCLATECQSRPWAGESLASEMEVRRLVKKPGIQDCQRLEAEREKEARGRPIELWAYVAEYSGEKESRKGISYEVWYTLIPKPVHCLSAIQIWLAVLYFIWHPLPEAGGVGMVAGRVCHELGEDKSISIDLRGRQSS